MVAPDAQRIAWVLNHNQTRALLKHVVRPHKLAFRAYTFGVSDKIAGNRIYVQTVGRGGLA